MAITAAEAPKNLFPLIEQVNNDRTPVEITSKRGDAVLVSRADYDALEETAHVLRSPANARRLLDSLAQAEHGDSRGTPTRTLTRPAMRVVFAPNGWADYTHWLAADRNNVKRMNRLMEPDPLSRTPVLRR